MSEGDTPGVDFKSSTALINCDCAVIWTSYRDWKDFFLLWSSWFWPWVPPEDKEADIDRKLEDIRDGRLRGESLQKNFSKLILRGQL